MERKNSTIEIAQILENLEIILRSGVKNNINAIEAYLNKLDDYDLLNEEWLSISNNIKSYIQREAEEALLQRNDWGAILGATGVGKSKIIIDKLSNEVSLGKNNIKALLVVPTQRLRDNNWKDEFDKWGKLDIWENNVERCCYASFNKYENTEWDYVILDELHNITEDNVQFFKNNSTKKLIALTATRPKSTIKIALLKGLNILPVYQLNLEESIKLRIVNPYNINIISVPLDTENAYIEVGKENNKFFTTEAANYNYLTKNITKVKRERFNYAVTARKHFLANVLSKQKATKYILENIIPKDKRTIIFCGSKEQANKLCNYRYYSKPTKPRKLRGIETDSEIAKYNKKLKRYEKEIENYQGDKALESFMTFQINRLSCIDAINEGINILNIDYAVLNEIDSNPQNFFQRMGRILRFRVGIDGTIFIIMSRDTQEEVWMRKGTKGINQSKIRWYNFEDIINNKIKIKL